MQSIQVQDRQNIIDIAVQYYGSAASVFDLCVDNGLELDSNLTPGQTLLIEDTYPASANGDAAGYLKANNAVVVSMSELDTSAVLGDNLGDIIVTNQPDYIGV